MNLDNRVVYLNHGTLIQYALPSQALQTITQNLEYNIQQPNAILDISRLVGGWYFVMYRAETPDIRRPQITPYDLPIPPPLIKIPRIRPPRRGPGRQPPIPPGRENPPDKKKKEPPPTIN